MEALGLESRMKSGPHLIHQTTNFGYPRHAEPRPVLPKAGREMSEKPAKGDKPRKVKPSDAKAKGKAKAKCRPQGQGRP